MEDANTRKETDQRLTHAFEVLNAELELAFRPVAPHLNSLKEERAQYSLALMSVGEFIWKTTGDTTMASNFFELAFALRDLSAGTVQPFLMPDTYGNRRPDSSRIWLARADVCLALQAIATAGMTKREAAEYLAKTYPGIKGLVTAKSNKISQTILSWHSGFTRKTVKNEQASHVYGVFARPLANVIDSLPAPERLDLTKGFVDGYLDKLR